MLLPFYNFLIIPQNLHDFAIGTSPVSSSTDSLKSPFFKIFFYFFWLTLKLIDSYSDLVATMV